MGEPVQMLWIGSRLSALERLSIASFIANGHPVHLYTYAPVDGVPAETCSRDAREILPEDAVFFYPEGFGAGSPAAFANLFRYKLLYERGGLWGDSDMVCLRPLDFLVEMPYAFATQNMPPEPPETAGPRMNVCLMKAPPGSAFLRDCYAECAAVERSTLRWGMTGPDLATPLIVAHGLDGYALLPEVACPVDFWDIGALIGDARPLPPAAYAIHFWNEMWRANRLDKDARYPDGCAYEVLKRRYGIGI